MEASEVSSGIIYVFWGLIAAALFYGAVTSFREGETIPGRKLLAASAVALIAALALGYVDFPGKMVLAGGFVIVMMAGVYLFFRKPLSDPAGQGSPRRRVDESDTMFARMELIPGSPAFESYYAENPEKAPEDAKIRSLPGLLSANSLFYHPVLFKEAEANFGLIKYLRQANKKQPKVDRDFLSGGGEATHDIDPAWLTHYLKKRALQLGAHSAGVTLIRDYHLYTHGGREESRGRPVKMLHTHAIAFTVEMDFDSVRTAPAAPITLESSRQYLNSATLALELSELLQRLGYDARAHIDGDYELICPLVARDAGLGEIGRMGLLMTPRLGPRVRIAVVTTDAPLVADGSRHDPTMIEFCRICEKCADCCPGKSIPQGEMEDTDGIRRWKINAESCYRYWCIAGTDCGRCMAVCPFSHPDNVMHQVIRRLIRRSGLMVKLALAGDDLLYGRRPKPAMHRADIKKLPSTKW
ncbi:MAG: hypothetical protein ACLFN2_05110 [Bacteroidales bacterium]